MVDYPIIDPVLREILISLELLIVFVFMEFSTFFLYRYRNNKKSGIPSTVELNWSIIFGCFGIAFIFYIYGDFFTAAINRNFFLTCAYLSLAIGGLLFVYHLELTKIKTIKTIKNYKLTILASCFIGVFIIQFLFFPSLLQIAAYMLSIFAYGIVLIYFIKVIKQIWSFYKGYSFGLLLGIIVWLLGYTGNTDFAITLFGTIHIRMIGDVLCLVGMVLVGVFVSSIPSLGEIGWREKIKYIILANNTGISLYSEYFRERKEINEVLIAGALFGIDIFLKNVLKDVDLKVISKGTDVIIIEKGKYITGIMVVEQDLRLLRYLLKELITQFELFFTNILNNYKGDIIVFKPAKHLISSIFTYKKI